MCVSIRGVVISYLCVAIDLSRDNFLKSTAIPVSKDDKSPDKGNSTNASRMDRMVTIKDKSSQPESKMDSSLL